MLSIVVPVFNEEESLGNFYKELDESFLKDYEKHEIVFVDDGSADSTLDILKSIAKKNTKVRIYSFRKNRGKSEALSYGLSKAIGECVITMDADLQDPPKEAYKIIGKLKEGYDHVSGWRKHRNDSGIKIVFSKFFNFAVSLLFNFKLHDYNCGLKGYTLAAAQSLRLYGGLHRFIPLLLHQDGFRVCEISVAHNKRKYGKSKYGISKIWKDLPDMFTIVFLLKYSNQPLHFFGVAGLIVFAFGFGILFYLSYLKIILGNPIGDRPILLLGILLVLSGFQLLFTGFLGDLIINLSHNPKAGEKKEVLLKYSSEGN
jgi:glycosyltransferase involved in cell wall biosynthesis